MNNLELKTFDTLVEDAINLRYKVFIDEQKFTIEIDDLDPICTHIVLYKDTLPIGVCRYYEQEGIYHFGRLAIEKEYRKQGYAEMILQEAERQVYEKGGRQLVLSAQCRVSEFYDKQGYKKVSDIYYDEYCEHVDMVKDLYAPRKVRKATLEDVPAMLAMYKSSRERMYQEGNTTQWPANYPIVEDLEEDIKKGHMYIICNDKESLGCFALIVGDDPTYHYIEDGNWKYNDTYAVIHRLASSQKEKYVFNDMIHFAKSKMNYLRIDTHKDNVTMQHLITKHGFVYSGIIYVANGTPRLAYEYKKSEVR